MLGRNKDVDGAFDLDEEPKNAHHRIRNHLSNRYNRASQALHGYGHSSAANSRATTIPAENESATHRQNGNHRHPGNVLDEVTAWLKEEKAKKTARKARKKVKKADRKRFDRSGHEDETTASDASRRTSSSEDSGLDLSKLESILGQSIASSVDLSSSTNLPVQPQSSLSLRRLGSRAQRVNRRASTLKPAETDAQEEELFVPTCDAILDNSKTFAHGIGASTDALSPRKGSEAGHNDPWKDFKHDIVRIAHTLKLSRWRHLPMSLSDDIRVERLSGALTNAVYVVSPPEDYDPNGEYGEPRKNRTFQRRYPT